MSQTNYYSINVTMLDTLVYIVRFFLIKTKENREARNN